jgi:putative membrane protein
LAIIFWFFICLFAAKRRKKVLRSMNHQEHLLWGFGLGGFWVVTIIKVLLGVLVIIALIYLIKWLAAQGGADRQPLPPREESALDILNKRYARGEINKEEFEERKKALMT